jgi:hypothetical protein
MKFTDDTVTSQSSIAKNGAGALAWITPSATSACATRSAATKGVVSQPRARPTNG